MEPMDWLYLSAAVATLLLSAAIAVSGERPPVRRRNVRVVGRKPRGLKERQL